MTTPPPEYQPRWLHFCRTNGHPLNSPRIGWRYVQWIDKQKGAWMKSQGMTRRAPWDYVMSEADQESFDKFLEALPDYGQQGVMVL